MAVVALVVIALALIGCGPAPLPAGDPARPDILLVSIDTLRADHLSSYGAARPTSPKLDAIAAEGLRFTNAYSASPWTLPSHLTMLSGLWPVDHGVVEDNMRAGPEIPLVPEALQRAGYATGGFVSTIYVSATYGFSRGFSTWEDFGITERDNLRHPVRADEVLAKARAFGGSLPAGQPAFVFVHLYDVHYPYLPPEPYNSMFDPPGTDADTAYKTYKHYLKNPVPAERMAHLTAQYDEGIRYVDDRLGAFFAEWRAARPAYVVVTSDHGEELGERGSWGHAHTLKPEALHVPLIVSGPGVAPAVRDDRVGTIDVAATVAALAGLPWTGDGRDVRAPVPPRPFFLETTRFDTLRLGLLDGPLRLDLTPSRRELFDWSADPTEQADVAGARADEALAAERRIYERIGEPWALVDGAVTVGGASWQGGAGTRGKVEAPGSFGVWPPDAKLKHQPGGDVPAGGLPGKVEFRGETRSVDVALDGATRAQLEALGYVQGGQ